MEKIFEIMQLEDEKYILDYFEQTINMELIEYLIEYKEKQSERDF